jgi:hypothetical protein
MKSPLFAFALVLFASVPSSWAGEKEAAPVRLAGRGPASMSGSDAEVFRMPMLTLPKKAERTPRWRLMGTCRNDVGTQQNLSGMGYGNCLGN